VPTAEARPMKRSAPLVDEHEPKTLTLPEAARYLLLHEQTLLARARAGRIPGAAKPGKRWVFLEEGLRQYLLSLSPYRGPLARLGTSTSPVTREEFVARLGLPTKRRRRDPRATK
jgi:excisionase family DNA binding protein